LHVASFHTQTKGSSWVGEARGRVQLVFLPSSHFFYGINSPGTNKSTTAVTQKQITHRGKGISFPFFSLLFFMYIDLFLVRPLARQNQKEEKFKNTS